jgi:hypothetical protein
LLRKQHVDEKSLNRRAFPAQTDAAHGYDGAEAGATAAGTMSLGHDKEARTMATRASKGSSIKRRARMSSAEAERGFKKQARAAIRDAFPVHATQRAKALTKERLIPGLRTRLLRALREVDDLRSAELDDELFVDYLALTTGSAVQTARRWIAPSRPGLPDLVSFSMLCEALQLDVNWMLGLTKTRLSLAPAQPEWLGELMSEIAKGAGDRVGVRVRGDEMEPAICAGDWVLIDKRDRRWGVNGTYLLEWDGREVLRDVETRIGAGLVLICANRKYADTVLEGEEAARSLGVRLLGRVTARIATQRL